LRYFAGAVAFGFAAVWIMATLAGALVCVLAAVVAYGVVAVAEHLRPKRAFGAGRAVSTSSPGALQIRTPEVEGLPQWADTLNRDLGHVYEPTAATAPLSREAEYGWPLNEDTIVTSSTIR